MIILNKTAKNRVYRFLLIDELKIFKKDYLIKILKVPLNIRVIKKKKINNL
jgi:hypothetical protein